MNNIASFHLATWPGALGALARLGTDRLRLKHVEGLVFGGYLVRVRVVTHPKEQT